jgi:type III pantothenate kinase
MQAGIMFGYAGLVDGIVNRMKAEAKTNPLVIATGGLANIIAPETKTIEKIEEMLTLNGLRFIYELNKK